VNPYQIVANNGRYYLIGNYDKYDNIAHFRIDRMTSVVMLDERRKPVSQVTDFKNGFSLPKHMAEHIYMFSGKSVNVRMVAKKDLMDDLIDWFGKDFKIRKTFEDEMLVDVKCNESAMKFWALQYGPYVEVLEPAELREEIKESVKGMWEKYDNGE
jgi:predicted DNA-binding transcriptional regulator YafY